MLTFMNLRLTLVSSSTLTLARRFGCEVPSDFTMKPLFFGTIFQLAASWNTDFDLKPYFHEICGETTRTKNGNRCNYRTLEPLLYCLKLYNNSAEVLLSSHNEGL